MYMKEKIKNVHAFLSNSIASNLRKYNVMHQSLSTLNHAVTWPYMALVSAWLSVL